VVAPSAGGRGALAWGGPAKGLRRGRGEGAEHRFLSGKGNFTAGPTVALVLQMSPRCDAVIRLKPLLIHPGESEGDEN
jgi:hypothetical protein